MDSIFLLLLLVINLILRPHWTHCQVSDGDQLWTLESVASPSWGSNDIDDLLESHTHSYNYDVTSPEADEDDDDEDEPDERPPERKRHTYGYETKESKKKVSIGSDSKKPKRPKKSVKSSKGSERSVSISSIAAGNLRRGGSRFGSSTDSDRSGPMRSKPYFGLPAYDLNTKQVIEPESTDSILDVRGLKTSDQLTSYYEDSELPHMLGSEAQTLQGYHHRVPRELSGPGSRVRRPAYITPAYILTEYADRVSSMASRQQAHRHHQTADQGHGSVPVIYQYTNPNVEYAETSQPAQEQHGQQRYYAYVQPQPAQSATVALAPVPVQLAIPVQVSPAAAQQQQEARDESNEVESRKKFRKGRTGYNTRANRNVIFWKRGLERLKTLIDAQQGRQQVSVISNSDTKEPTTAGSSSGQPPQQQQMYAYVRPLPMSIMRPAAAPAHHYVTHDPEVAGHVTYADSPHSASNSGNGGAAGGQSDRFMGWTNVDYD